MRLNHRRHCDLRWNGGGVRGRRDCGSTQQRSSEFELESSWPRACACLRLLLSRLRSCVCACQTPPCRATRLPVFLLSAASPTHTGTMSQMQKADGGKAAKRKTDVAPAAESPAEAPAADDRTVRQRTERMHSAREADSHAAAATSSSSSHSVSPPVVLSFMRLAVVERQLIMQGLDLVSLGRLASTCKQMRGEAMDKEAGRFIPKPRSSADRLFAEAHSSRPSLTLASSTLHIPLRCFGSMHR